MRNLILALLAFAVLAGFFAILIIEVPSPDLIIISLFVVALAAYDFFTSHSKR